MADAADTPGTKPREYRSCNVSPSTRVAAYCRTDLIWHEGAFMSEQSRASVAPANKQPSVAKNDVDRMPTTPKEWEAFAALPAADRSAVYLRSIRSMLVFFTVLAVLGVIGVFILGVANLQ